jgi:HEAT repeat protein
MALWDGWFGRRDSAAQVRGLASKAVAKFGPPENRREALEKLIDLGTPEAFAALLQRFTVRVDPTITDDEEKAFVFEALVAAGEKAVEPLKAFLAKSEQPTWALKTLEQLLPATDVVELLLRTLEHEGPDWTRDPEKKITLLRHLDGVKDVQFAHRLAPFLADMSEDVRFATTSILAQQEQGEELRLPLIEALLAAGEQQSERMRRHVAEALARTGVSTKGHQPAVQAALPAGFTIDRDGHVRAGKA